MQSWLDRTYYTSSRERHYRFLKRKIILEPILFEDKNLKDYKIFTHNHKAKVIQVDIDRSSAHSRQMYSLDWKKIDMNYQYHSRGTVPQPKLLNEMLNITTKISNYFKFIRVDLYTNDNEIFVGELTNHPGNAGERFLDSDLKPVALEQEIKLSKYFFDSSVE